MTDLALLVMRLGLAGLLLTFHGGPRSVRAFNHLVSGDPWPFVGVVADLGFPLALAFAVASTLAESLGAALVALGLWTRIAAITLGVNMGVAVYNEAGAGDSIELPALYLVGVMLFALAGPGRLSVERVRAARGRGYRPRMVQK